jgi:hypothetical protein
MIHIYPPALIHTPALFHSRVPSPSPAPPTPLTPTVSHHLHRSFLPMLTHILTECAHR